MDNICNTCIHSRKVPGSSHHLKCVAPWAEDVEPLFLASFGIGVEVRNKETKETLLAINPHGWKNGWANFPFNFDPIWITCKLGEEREVDVDTDLPGKWEEVVET